MNRLSAALVVVLAACTSMTPPVLPAAVVAPDAGAPTPPPAPLTLPRPTEAPPGPAPEPPTRRAPQPPPPPPPRRQTAAASDPSACSSTEDCVLACGVVACCDGLCGCGTALNRKAVEELRARPKLDCRRQDCPAVGCLHRMYFPLCEEGRCVARSMDDGPLGPGIARVPAPAVSCSPTSRSTLDGVRLSFAPGPCSVTRAQLARGIDIPYVLEVASDPGELVVEPLDSGRCGRPGPGGLAVFEEIEGHGQRWCLCDVGLCPPGVKTARPLVGTTHRSFRWDGRNFGGPSDTGRTPGAPFPPGSYTVRITARGTRQGAPFEVVATRVLVVR